MYPRLTAQIQKQLPALLDRYDEQLCLVPGYSSLPEPARRGLEQQVLQLMVDCLVAGDDSALIQYISERAEQVLAHGFQPEWFQQAVTVAEGIITPLIKNVDEGNFVWRAMNRAQTAAWKIVARERQHVEQTLRESEARYQTIFNSTPIMFWLKDTHNRTLRINRAAANLEGVNPADVEGKSAYDLYPPEQAEAFYQDDLAVINSGNPKLGIIEQHTSLGTGKLMWLETGKTPVHNEQGETIGVLAFAVDITERTQAEEALRHSAESQQRAARYLRATVEATDEIMRAPDLDTVYRRTVELAREKFDVERCGLYLIDESLQSMNGTFGTDDQRHTSDERGVRRPTSEFEDLLAASPDQLWIVRETTQIYFENEVEHTVGTGWAAATILRGASGPIAVLFNDSALSGQPVDETQQEALAVYCSAVGSIIERKRAEEERRAAFENEQIASERLRAIVTATDELIRTTDLDVLYRRAVELARERLGVERCALYVLDESREWVLGTFGTDAAGHTTDERSNKEPAHNHQVITMPREQQWVTFQTELKYWEGEQDQVVGTGWNVATAIRSATGPIGIMFNDAAMSRKPYEESLQQSLALYCSMLANIIENKHLELQIRQSLQQRGVQVQTSTEVAQEIASATDLNELFSRVVTLIKERFNYYHAQIFRYDPTRDAVVLITGYGTTGQKMLEAGHQLPMGRGVVGSAAATGESILAADVRQDEDWRPNPNLPETRGELAVPIKLRDQVLGVLDVQSAQSNTLTDDDRLLLEGLCGQIAIAMESTRLLEELRRGEAQLSQALHISKLAYWEYDVEKDLFLFNDQFYSIFHTTAEQEGGYQLSSAQYAGKFVYPDDLPIVGSEIEKALNSTDRHYSRDVVHRIQYADGGVGYITVSINIDRDENGKILRYYGANQDISERKRVEEELARSAQLLRTIVDNSRDLIYIKNRQSEFLLASQALAQLVGAKTTDELLGKTDFDYFPRDLAKKFYQDDQNIIQSGQPVLGIEEPGQTADGQPTWMSTTKIPFLNRNGEIEGIVGVGRDITARKHAEDELTRSAQLLNTIINNSRDLIYIKNTKSEFLIASQALARLMGVKSASDLIGKSDFDFFPYELANKYYTDDQSILQAGEPLIDIEERSVYPDGTQVWLLTTKIPYRATDGTLLGLLGIGRDITERKRAEQQMEETLRETERLYAAVSAEGWKTYRQSGQLPQGYRFDRALLEPAGQLWEPELAQAVSEEKTIATHDADRAVAVSPLAVRGAIIGALGVYDNPDQPLRPDDLALLELVSEQVALALESARLFEQTQRDAEREHTLNRIAAAISRSSSVKELLPTVLEVTLEVIGFDCGLATLFDTESNTLRMLAQRDLPEGLLKRLQSSLGGTLCEYVYIHGQATFLEDMRQGAPLDVSGLLALGLKSYVGIPLIYQERVVGTLCMFGHTTRPLPEKIDVLLQSVGQQIGVGVTNVRLFEQTQRDAERERTISAISERIYATSDVRQLMQITAEELRRVTGSARAAVRLNLGTGDTPEKLAHPDGGSETSEGRTIQ